MKNLFIAFIIGLLVIASSACSSSGTTAVGNPGSQTSATISIGQLQDDGQADISIPLEVFGDAEDDVTDATVDIFRNGSRYVQGLDASSYYNQVAAAVQFTMSELESGDIIKFTINLESGETVDFIGTVSDTAESDATTNAAQLLVDAICSGLSGCNDEADFAECTSAILDTDQLVDEFFGDDAGVDENSLSMTEIAEGLDSGDFEADSDTLDTCLSDLAALSCEELETGFDSSSPDNYENVENFISESCAGVLSLSAESASTDTATSTDDSTLPGNEIGNLIDTLCTAIDACASDLERDECQSGLLATEQLSPEIFIGDDSLETSMSDTELSLEDVSDGLDSGEYEIADNDAYDDCITAIEALSCSEIATGYTNNNPDNFEGVENFLPAVCEFMDET